MIMKEMTESTKLLIQASEKVVELAKEIAFDAHSGQFRFDGVTNYIMHPLDVVNRLRFADATTRAVAWLHDVLEDTDFTADDLLNRGIPRIVVSAVLILSKDDQEYEDYLAEVSKYPITRQVKIADILSNLSDNPTKKMVAKYSNALSLLLHKEINNYWHPVLQ